MQSLILKDSSVTHKTNLGQLMHYGLYVFSIIITFIYKFQETHIKAISSITELLTNTIDNSQDTSTTLKLIFHVLSTTATSVLML